MLAEEKDIFISHFIAYGQSLLNRECYTPLLHRVLAGMTGIGPGVDPGEFASDMSNIRRLWSALVEMDPNVVSEEFGGPQLAHQVKRAARESAPAIVFWEMAEKGSPEEIVSYFKSRGSGN